MTNGLQKAFDLSRKTGDKLIVFDSSRPENTFVVLPIDEYEKMVSVKKVTDLTEGELIDKINRDIALWKSDQEEQVEGRTDSEYNGENKPNNQYLAMDNEGKEEPRKKWGIPKDRKEAALEVVGEETPIRAEITF